MKKILYVGSECMPFAATGGLGDVMGSLPASLKEKYPEDYDVREFLTDAPSAYFVGAVLRTFV